MAYRHHNPFAEPSRLLKTPCNPYLPMMISAAETGTLPLRFGEGLKGMAGHWQSGFGPLQPQQLALEIGCHLGKTVCELAEDYPEIGFIAADITFKRVCTTATRASNRGLGNVCSVLFNAKHLNELFAEQELDYITLFYPDPWSKPREAKHRLIDQTFVERCWNALKEKGRLWFKTDQQGYFEEACRLFRAAGFIDAKQPPFLKRTYTTTFERKFLLQKLPTFEIVFEKKA